MLLVMRRFGIGGFDTLELHAFDGLRDFLLQRLHFRQLPRLLRHDLVELVVLMFQMRKARFNFLQPLREFIVHGINLTLKIWKRTKFAEEFAESTKLRELILCICSSCEYVDC